MLTWLRKKLSVCPNYQRENYRTISRGGRPARYEPAKYWVVPNVGVVKYQYTYLLTDRELPDGTVANLLFSADFELSQVELPDDHSR